MIQSVLISKKYNDLDTARKYIRQNKFIQNEFTYNFDSLSYYRFRQIPPNEKLYNYRMKLVNPHRMIYYIYQIPKKLYLVGSRARIKKTNLNNSDFDYVTTYNFDIIINLFNVKKIISQGDKYISFITNTNKKIDVWKVPIEYLESNIILRTLDKLHFIALANLCNKLGYKLSFNGIEINKIMYPVKDIIDILPQFHKFNKYINI